MTDKAVRLGFVVAEFNRDLIYMMVIYIMEMEAEERAQYLGAAVHDHLYVPGVYDMPLAIHKLLKKSDIDAVITIDCVIKGITDHDQIVVQHAARKIIDLSIEFEKPVALGISGPGMTRLEAEVYGKNGPET